MLKLMRASISENVLFIIVVKGEILRIIILKFCYVDVICLYINIIMLRCIHAEAHFAW